MNQISIATVFLLLGMGIPTFLFSQSQVHLIKEHHKTVAIAIIDRNLSAENISIKKLSSGQTLRGTFSRKEDSIFFHPIIPFQPKQTYQLIYGSEEMATFSVSPPYTSPFIVEKIYPTTDTLPVNFLKFYIRFSHPMSERSPYPHIYLLSEAGDTMEHSFLAQYPALWSSDHQTLTLWLDPGRVKRDLLLNQKYGHPLEGNKTYQLVLDTPLRSVYGDTLRRPMIKRFTTGTVDRSQPKLSTWTINVPPSHTSDSLLIEFPEAMDYLSTLDRILIFKEGEQLEGKQSLIHKEKAWIFRPSQQWKKGRYEIQVEAVIEDLAGNNLNRLFDRDILQHAKANEEFYRLSFNISN